MHYSNYKFNNLQYHSDCYIILTNKLVLNIINSYYVNIPLLRRSPATRCQNMFSINTIIDSSNELF